MKVYIKGRVVDHRSIQGEHDMTGEEACTRAIMKAPSVRLQDATWNLRYYCNILGSRKLC